MGKPFPSTFLGIAQYKIIKQLNISILQSEIHDITITANLFEISEMLAEIIWNMNEVLLLNFTMINPFPSTLLGNVQYKTVKQLQNSVLQRIIHNTTIIENLYAIS